MEKIFHGLMRSSSLLRSEKMKVVRMIEKSGKHPHTKEEVKAMLLATVSSWLSSSTSVEDVEVCKAVFKSWSTNNFLIMAETLIAELVGIIQSMGEKLEVTALCELIQVSLEVSETGSLPNNEADAEQKAAALTELYRLIANHVICSLLGSESTRILSSVAVFIGDHPQIVPWKTPSELLRLLILKLSRAKVDIEVADPREFIHQVNQVSRLIRNLWHKSPTPKHHILESLQVLFGIVSSIKEIDDVSVALCSVLQSVPESMIEEVCDNLIKDSKVSDFQMTNALTHMIDWLKWPKHATIHLWIIKISCGLAKDGRLVLLFGIVDELAGSIAAKLHHDSIRPTTLQVLTTLLLYHQKCPQAFHQCIPTMLELFDSVEDKSSLNDLSGLIQVLIYIHPGYPELYNTLMSKLSDYGVLTESYIQEIVIQYSVAEVRHRFNTMSTSSRLVRKGERVGLENLGNTCFLNSVLQALYNVDMLQSDLLKAELMSNRCILHYLQRVFASLYLTQRAVVNPSDYVRVGWPSWFTQGQQQDSSEYLRFLLDNIHEQSKKLLSNNDVTEYFTGSDSVITRCHNCDTETQREQRFYDIALHFPEDKPVHESVSLIDMLSDYSSKPEQLHGNNQFFCDKCESLQDATRKLSDCSLPSCLILTLCRFSYNVKTNKNVKLRTPVTYPSRLVLKDREYRLNAVIVHSGASLNGGHYYTYACQSNREQWYLFNDVRVTPCTSPSELATEFKGTRLSSDTPYILLYTDSASASQQMNGNHIVSTSLQSLVTRDNLQLQRDLQMAEQKKAARKKVCQPSTQSWYNYSDDNDDDQIPPGADNTLDLSGSRFIF